MTIACLWQSDPSEMGDNWSVACPGPSLEKSLEVYTYAHDRPCIAVEGAAAHPEIAYDWWCCWERPRHPIHDRCLERARERRPAVLTSWAAAPRWETLLEDGVGTPAHPLDAFVIAQHKTKDPIPLAWRSAGLDRSPSWLLALRFAVLRGLASRVTFYGLDLAGEGYALDLPDAQERDAASWEGRWIGERRILARAVELCEDAGIELVGLPEYPGPINPK